MNIECSVIILTYGNSALLSGVVVFSPGTDLWWVFCLRQNTEKNMKVCTEGSRHKGFYTNELKCLAVMHSNRNESLCT